MKTSGWWLVALVLCVACGAKSSSTGGTDAGSTSGADVAGDSLGSDATSTTGSDTTGGTMQITDLCPQLVVKQCAALDKCGCPMGKDGVAACQAKQANNCQKSIVGYIGGVSLGNIQFNAANAKVCLDGFDALATSCALPTNRVRPAACRALFIDTAQIGAPCAAFSPGLLCANQQGVCDPQKGNICTPRPTEGQPCVANGCGDKLACDSQVCRTPGGEGGTCTSDEGCQLPLTCGPDGKCHGAVSKGGVCSTSQQCGADLACVGGACNAGVAVGGACMGDVCNAGETCLQTATQMVCRPKAKLDESCDGPEACEPGLFCSFESGSRCKPLPKLGEKCPGFQCAADLVCDSTSVCVAAPKAGDTCLVGASPNCAKGLACDETTGKCGKPGGPGTPCPSGVCAEGSTCNYASTPPKCMAPVGKGEACYGMDAACQAGLFCDGAEMVCKPIVAVGGACTMSNACGPGFTCQYASNQATAGTCAPNPSKVGDPCQGTCDGGLRCGMPDGVCAKGICVML